MTDLDRYLIAEETEHREIYPWTWTEDELLDEL